MGTHAAPPQKGSRAPPQFSAHVYCGQTAAWIKMPLGTEVGLGPNDIVLDGDPAAPSPKRGQSPLPNFRPMSIVAKLLDESRWHLAWRLALVHATLVSFIISKAISYSLITGLGTTNYKILHCARRGHSSLPKKGAEPRIFGPCLLWLNGWMD